MTIEVTSTYVRAAGNGVTTVFNFPFKITSASDLIVLDILDSTGVPTTKTLTTDYNVAISVTDEGGSVSFFTAPASGHTIDLRRTVDLTQPEDIRNQGRFLPEIHEGIADRLAMQVQDTRRLLALAPRMPDSEATAIDWDTVMSLANRKGKFFSFDGTTGDFALASNIGATSLTSSLIGTTLDSLKQTAVEISAGVTPVNYAYLPDDVRRYGLGTLTDATAWAGWYAVLGNSGTVSSQLDNYRWNRVEPTSFGLGKNALINTQLGALENLAIGESALASQTTGVGNLGIGFSAASLYTTGSFTTTVGINSMLLYTNGLGFNTVLGYGGYARGLTGYNNVAIGFEALHDNGAGADNVAIGAAALHAGTNAASSPAPADPSSCVAIGSQASKFSYGSFNVTVGWSAMTGGATSSGEKNVAIGYTAMQFFTTASKCVSVGYQASLNKTTGTDDVIVGHQAGLSSTTGGFNVYLGSLAGYYNATCQQNVFVGYLAGQGQVGNAGGGANVAIGASAMDTHATVNNCVAVGFQALRTVTGNGNVAIGHTAGTQETSGTNNTWVGEAAGAAQTTGFTNTTNVGYQATSTGSNQMTLGNSSVATLRCQQTSITALSDARFKKNVRPLDLPKGALEDLQPVIFEWIDEGMPTGPQVGFIAQSLDAWQEKWGLQWMGLVNKTNPERFEATPHKLLFPLILGFQKLSARIAALEGDDQWRAALKR